jgi:hypothetical protein
MAISANVIRNDVGLQAVKKALAILKTHEVMVGIPEDTTGRKKAKGTPVNNAELLFIHTNGSPANNIPPRPVLEPAIKHNKERISKSYKKAIDAALDGDMGGVLPALDAAGLNGQNIVRKYFTESNGWEKNSDVTVYGSNEYSKDEVPVQKLKKDGTRRKMPKKPIIKGKGSSRPLIDTGEMRKSITYVVREV